MNEGADDREVEEVARPASDSPKTLSQSHRRDSSSSLSQDGDGEDLADADSRGATTHKHGVDGQHVARNDGMQGDQGGAKPLKRKTLKGQKSHLMVKFSLS